MAVVQVSFTDLHAKEDYSDSILPQKLVVHDRRFGHDPNEANLEKQRTNIASMSFLTLVSTVILYLQLTMKVNALASIL